MPTENKGGLMDAFDCMKEPAIAGALFLNISKLFTTQSGFIHTVKW